MKIISCDGCAVLLDADKLEFPKDIFSDGHGVDETKAMWDGQTWAAFCNCPVCQHPITVE